MANGTSGAMPFAQPSIIKCAKLAESSNIPKPTYDHSLNMAGIMGIRIIMAPTTFKISSSNPK